MVGGVPGLGTQDKGRMELEEKSRLKSRTGGNLGSGGSAGNLGHLGAGA